MVVLEQLLQHVGHLLRSYQCLLQFFELVIHNTQLLLSIRKLDAAGGVGVLTFLVECLDLLLQSARIGLLLNDLLSQPSSLYELWLQHEQIAEHEYHNEAA
jgi:hypothetical protein